MTTPISCCVADSSKMRKGQLLDDADFLIKDKDVQYNRLSASEAAASIAGQAPGIVFINAELRDDDPTSEPFKGIEILTWLRVKYRLTCPIVIYGSMSSQEILSEHPEHVIIHAPGNLYFQLQSLPALTRDQVMSIIKKNSLKSKNEIWDKYPPFLNVASGMDEFRHREANWWGLKCLWDAHREVDKNFKDDYPEPLEEKGNSPRNSVVSTVLFDKNYSKGYPNSDLINRIQTHVHSLHNIKPLPNVIFIDDQANAGWSKVLSHIIYGDQEQSTIDSFFKVFVPQKGNQINSIFKDFESHVKESHKKGRSLDLLILDLRLFDESGIRKDVFNLSGVLLFKQIRAAYKNIPILIVTASNKINVFSHLYELEKYSPPNGFWIKEGIDFHKRENDKLDSYLSLVSQLNGLVKQKRKDKFVRELNLKTFKNEQTRTKWLEVVDKGFPDCKTDLSNVQFESETLIKLNQDACLIDTNIFINKDLSFLFEYSQSILLLCKLRSEDNLEQVGLHINVFSEILRYGMRPEDGLLNFVARQAHKNLKGLYKAKQLDVIIPNAFLDNPEMLKEVITDKKPYADDVLFYRCKSVLKSGKSLLFISDDKNSGSTVKQLKSFLSDNPHYKPVCKMMSGRELVSIFSSHLELLGTPNAKRIVHHEFA